MRLLVIEDEDRLSGILKSKLGDVGFTVDIAGSAADAGAALELINYDAVVLDLGLPDGDGLAVLRAARRIGKALPILILTARDAVEAIRSLFPWLRHLFADSAYAGPKLEAALAKLGKWTIEIVKRPQNAVRFELLPRRWVVERTLAWLNRNRRLAKSLPPRRRGISRHPSPVPRLGSSWPPCNCSLGE